jgi:hypothetical protein
VTTPLSAPPVAADYLTPLTAQLSQCLGGNSAACSQAIDAHYTENGFTTFATAHPQIAVAGVTMGTPQTLEFLTGTGGAQEALISIPYTTSGGVAGTVVTVVQQTGPGTWDVIGNQQQYNITISSYLSRWQFLDPHDAPYSRYESGLGISIPVGGVNPANLASASVTGPGINGTLYLVPRSGTGNSTLALTNTQQTSVPTGGVTTPSNTNLYRWSWAPVPGATATFTPGTRLGVYAPSPVDLSTVPQFASYTVTFYDAAGAQIGQPTTVMNTTPPISAAAGAGVAWQSLATSVQSDFLKPNGALAGAQSSVNLSWSNLVNGQNIAPVATKAQIQAVPGIGVMTGEVDGWWPGPATFAASGQYTASVVAGMSQNGVQQRVSACQFPALQTGASHMAELYWNVGQTTYYNIWKYQD